MATEIPTQYKFQHLMAHTFPGFFSAITLFMLIDIFSPTNWTSLVFSKGIDGLIAFTGFVILIGSILGVMIDGIHHYFIEKSIFDKFPEMTPCFNERKFLIVHYRMIKNNKKNMFYPYNNEGEFPKNVQDLKPFGHISLTEFYLFKELSDKFITIYDYLIDGYYSYSEFYSNTFLSLIPFSLVAPIYAYSVLNISGGYFFYQFPLIIVLASLIVSILALLSAKCSYQEYQRYNRILNATLRGYIEPLIPAESSIGSVSPPPTVYSISSRVEIKDIEVTKKG